MKLRVKKYNNEMVVESFRFFDFLGLNKDYYSKWLKCYLKVGLQNVDYFNITKPTDDDVLCKKERKRYLFTLNFAICICLSTRTPESTHFRYELLRIEKDILSGKEKLRDFNSL